MRPERLACSKGFSDTQMENGEQASSENLHISSGMEVWAHIFFTDKTAV